MTMIDLPVYQVIGKVGTTVVLYINERYIIQRGISGDLFITSYNNSTKVRTIAPAMFTLGDANDVIAELVSTYNVVPGFSWSAINTQW